MMNHHSFDFWGMHLIWWGAWLFLLIWIFAIRYNIPGQRAKKDSTLDILKKRLATGEISNEEFLEKKKMLL